MTPTVAVVASVRCDAVMAGASRGAEDLSIRLFLGFD